MKKKSSFDCFDKVKHEKYGELILALVTDNRDIFQVLIMSILYSCDEEIW